MAQSSDEVRLAPFGSVYTAPFGTAGPVNVSTPMATVDSDWAELGFLDENGVQITPNAQTNDINGWQTPHPLKVTLSTVSVDAKFNMLQVNQDTTALFFFGEEWTNQAGIGRLRITNAIDLTEKPLCVEWVDDEEFTNRLYFPRGIISDRDSMQLQRTEATAFGVTYRALESDGVLVDWLSDNPDLIPAT